MVLRTIFLSLSFLMILGVSYASERPNFPRVDILLNGKKHRVELARTEEQRSYGLMKITKIPEAVIGMVFDFETEQILSFWMKNTYIDLSIGFINSAGILTEIINMKATSVMTRESQLKIYASKGKARFALEVPKSWFKNNKIKVGAKFKLL